MALEFLIATDFATNNRAADILARLTAGIPDTYDVSEGSITYDLLAAFAEQLETLYLDLDQVAAQAYPQTATGDALDAIAASFALTRLPAAYSTCQLAFDGTAGDVIPGGTLVTTLSPNPDLGDVIAFALDADLTLDVNGLGTGAATAVVAGAASNVSAGAIVIVEDDAIVATVTNSASSGGVDDETDDALRERLLAVLGGARGAGTAADYQAWALQIPGVSNAYVEPVWNGNGTVRVTVTDAYDAPVIDSVLLAVESIMAAYAPVGADVTVRTPDVAQIAVEAVVTLADGYTIETVLPSLEGALSSLYRSIEPGSILYLSQVSAALAKSPHVLDVTDVQMGVNGGAVAANNVTLASATKAVLGSPALTLTYA